MLYRLFSVLLLTLVLGQALGASALLESVGCVQCCPGEGLAEECPPDCDLCACCPSVRCVLAPGVQVPIDAGATASPTVDASCALPAADPREILHVPKALL